MRRIALGVAAAVAVTTALAGPLASPSTSQPTPRAAGAAQADLRPAGVSGAERTAARVPGFQVRRLAGGLDIPWDVQSLPNGRLIFTERARRTLKIWHQGRVRAVRFPSGMVWARGETGLMSIAVDPGFTRNRRIYTCQGGYRAGGAHEVRVVSWILGKRYRSVKLVRTIASGIPATSGRHGGCRLLIGQGSLMYVGTGDAATGNNPQALGSLGGKVLRLNRYTGAPAPGNPFISSSNAFVRYVYTYGHRNVQGLALRPNGSIWSAEHGPDRDDEVNILVAGGNYGWDPRGSGGSYDESVPMTDTSRYPSAIPARWRSGYPTVATSGATFLRGSQWGDLAGALAVAELKGSKMRFITFDSAGNYVRQRAALGGYGRLRSVTQIPGGDLVVTTSNGSGRDVLLRVHPVL